MTRSSTPFLPEGIIFDILVFLPAEILHNVMRCVCRGWYNVINSPEFISAHLQKSTNGFLIQSWNRPNVIDFVEIINVSGVRIRELRYEFRHPICASCDGLVLFKHDSNDLIFCVANLITNQILTLPPLSEPIRNDLCTLVYGHSIKRYKVVFLDYTNVDLMCANFTVGTDTEWRPIDTKHIPNTNWNYSFSAFSAPLSAGGYLYWTPRFRETFLLVLDVEAEILHRLPFPKVLNKKKSYFMVRESFLVLMVRIEKFLWEVLVLTELNKGEWTRLYNIDLTGQSGMLSQHQNWSLECYLFPLAWLKNGELVIFRISDTPRIYVLYNIKTKEVSSFSINKNFRSYHAHANSLVSLKVC
ncbi:uncharacterized protein LOC132316256 [Cornus florida]|uniref:uncharacterized protein LOC132316256 n=1 Tax=Cornus florida TaxID=4283 RepID=UPI0028A1B5D6|nr:uncharacterized protein LOC132316256 [Cornus florida]